MNTFKDIIEKLKRIFIKSKTFNLPDGKNDYSNIIENNDRNQFLESLKVKTTQNSRDSRTFSQIKEALLNLQNSLNDSKNQIYISGGTVSYLLADQDLQRLHDDIDTICSIDNISNLREILKETEFYKPEWDSINTATDGKDYGFEVQVNGVPVGIYPFVYEDKKLTQYTYDPYTHQCKMKDFKLESLEDYIQTYKAKDGKDYNTMSLEYIKKSKDMVGRPKDIADSKKIDELGLIRQEVMDRIEMPTKTNFVDMER